MKGDRKGDPSTVAGVPESALGGGGGGSGDFHAKAIDAPNNGVTYDASTTGVTTVADTFTLPLQSYNNSKAVVPYAYVSGSGNDDEIEIYAYPTGAPGDTVGIAYSGTSALSDDPFFIPVPGPSSSQESPPGLASSSGPPVWEVEINVTTATSGTGAVHAFGLFISTTEVADLGIASPPPGLSFVFPSGGV